MNMLMFIANLMVNINAVLTYVTPIHFACFKIIDIRCMFSIVQATDVYGGSQEVPSY